MYTGEKILKAKTEKYFHRRTPTDIYYLYAGWSFLAAAFPVISSSVSNKPSCLCDCFAAIQEARYCFKVTRKSKISGKNCDTIMCHFDHSHLVLTPGMRPGTELAELVDPMRLNRLMKTGCSRTRQWELLRYHQHARERENRKFQRPHRRAQAETPHNKCEVGRALVPESHARSCVRSEVYSHIRASISRQLQQVVCRHADQPSIAHATRDTMEATRDTMAALATRDTIPTTLPSPSGSAKRNASGTQRAHTERSHHARLTWRPNGASLPQRRRRGWGERSASGTQRACLARLRRAVGGTWCGRAARPSPGVSESRLRAPVWSRAIATRRRRHTWCCRVALPSNIGGCGEQERSAGGTQRRPPSLKNQRG